MKRYLLLILLLTQLNQGDWIDSIEMYQERVVVCREVNRVLNKGSKKDRESAKEFYEVCLESISKRLKRV